MTMPMDCVLRQVAPGWRNYKKLEPHDLITILRAMLCKNPHGLHIYFPVIEMASKTSELLEINIKRNPSNLLVETTDIEILFTIRKVFGNALVILQMPTLMSLQSFWMRAQDGSMQSFILQNTNTKATCLKQSLYHCLKSALNSNYRAIRRISKRRVWCNACGRREINGRRMHRVYETICVGDDIWS